MIDVHSISFGYGEQLVLDGIAFAVEPSTVVAVLGPSGVGKTTLLRLVAGLIPPASGTIEQGGGEGRRLRFGFVFQDASLLPWATVWDNATYAATVDPSRAGRVRELAERKLVKFDLWDARKLRPHELSGGMQQRLSLVRALAAEPDVLLLDEAFNQTDFVLRRRLISEVSETVSARQIGCLLVTHDLDDATLLADTIILLAGAPASVISKIEIKASRSDRLRELPEAAEERAAVRRDVLGRFHALAEADHA